MQYFHQTTQHKMFNINKGMKEKTNRKLLKWIKVFALLLFFLSSSSSYIYAQQGISSPYSRYGFGIISPKGFGQSFAMGGAGIALPGIDKLNNINPASLSGMHLNSVFFEFGTSFTYKSLSDGSDSRYKTDAALNYGAIGFPITKWWATSVGLNPYSTVNYSILDEVEYTDTEIQNYYTGEGGLSQFYWSNSFKPHKSIALGITASYLFGPIEYKIASSFIQEGYHSYSQIRNRVFFKDFYFSSGFQFNQKLGKRTRVYIGGVFETDQNINASITRTFINKHYYSYDGDLSNVITDTIANDTIMAKAKALLPGNMGVGIAFQFDSLFNSSDRLMLTADYYQRNWTNSELFGEQNTVLTNSRTIAGGIEYTPSIIGKKYYKVIRYRAGFRYGESYIKLDTETPLTEYAITFGFALPLRGNPSMINLGAEIGKFGTTANNHVEETFVNFHVNLSLFDFWFIKRKFD